MLKFLKFVICVWIEYRNACKKHPDFCSIVTTKEACHADTRAIQIKNDMEERNGTAEAFNLMSEEFCEACESYIAGDIKNTKKELAQLAQLCHRTRMLIDEEGT